MTVNGGLILAAPASGCGKTTITLGLLRALRNRGIAVRSAKSGPDYIDPQFHQAASGAPCVNLDAWAMSRDRIRTLATGPGLLLVEGAMGLFDGAPPDGKGATADLARHLNLPVVLIVDTAKQAGSIAALVQGFARFDARVRVAAVILNQVGSPRHDAMLRRALAPLGLPVIASIPRQSGLSHPSRHLGLVQAQERDDLEAFIKKVAQTIEETTDIDVLLALASPLPQAKPMTPPPPPAQSIAIASDRAFAFSYPHLLQDWRASGASISFFSPLANQPPPPADLIFLPGGYPELYAGKLAAAQAFMQGLRTAARTTAIYGECGGYMVLGNGLVDQDGTRHAMAGLLQLKTSFAAPKLHLGYRDLTPLGGPWPLAMKGHEFHYATTISLAGDPLFLAKDAEGNPLPDMGLQNGRVAGSFAHVIDQSI